MPDDPELGGVYRGKVSSVMEFGCFVELEGFRKRVGVWEGDYTG
jgi:ATP-dependent RNA helicase DHX8/PRP22